MVVEDRLAARIAQLLRQLAQALRGNARISPQLLLDPGLERIELRKARRPPVARRIVARKRATDRGAVKPREAMDLADRAPLHPMHPPDLGPLLHADHPLLLASASRTKRGSGPSRTLRPHAERGGQFSTGAGGPVFTRRPHFSTQGRECWNSTNSGPTVRSWMSTNSALIQRAVWGPATPGFVRRRSERPLGDARFRSRRRRGGSGSRGGADSATRSTTGGRPERAEAVAAVGAPGSSQSGRSVGARPVMLVGRMRPALRPGGC
jgi:hypothetical protein